MYVSFTYVSLRSAIFLNEFRITEKSAKISKDCDVYAVEES